jgi:hypothetical protein
MTDTRKLARVFLASPGDLTTERKVAKRAIDEFNELYAAEFGYHVELVGWEDTVSVFGRPQGSINRELSQCDYFLGMLWRKWGTPPDIVGPYTSGFEEEYTLSVQRRENEGKPEISIFFKDVSSDNVNDPGPELSKVLAFRKKLIDEKKLLFETFADVSEYEAKVRRCISQFVIRLRDKERAESVGTGQTPTADTEEEIPIDGSSSWTSPFSPEGLAFLRDFISKTQLKSSYETLTAADVARFRLLDTMVSQHGNDEQNLGAHDANLLYAARDRYDFGSKEIDGLAGSGLALYAQENAPVWYWLQHGNLDRGSLLTIFATVSSMPTRRAGALAAMALTEEPVPTDLFLSRKELLELWVSEKVPEVVKLAACRT